MQDFSIVMLVKTLGSLVGAPLMAVLWVCGMEVGGVGLGLPYFVSGVRLFFFFFVLFFLGISCMGRASGGGGGGWVSSFHEVRREEMRCCGGDDDGFA